MNWNDSVNALGNFLSQKVNQAKNYEMNQAPIGAILQGNLGEAGRRVANSYPDPRSSQGQKMMNNMTMGATMGGDMDFASALAPGYNASIDSLTSGPVDGSRIAMAKGTNIPTQSDPELRLYEAAFNKMDIPTMVKLAANHPGDARFLIHQTMGLVK